MRAIVSRPAAPPPLDSAAGDRRRRTVGRACRDHGTRKRGAIGTEAGRVARFFRVFRRWSRSESALERRTAGRWSRPRTRKRGAIGTETGRVARFFRVFRRSGRGGSAPALLAHALGDHDRGAGEAELLAEPPLDEPLVRRVELAGGE